MTLSAFTTLFASEVVPVPIAAAAGLGASWIVNLALKNRQRRSLRAYLLQEGFNPSEATLLSNADASAKSEIGNLHALLTSMKDEVFPKRLRWRLRTLAFFRRLESLVIEAIGLSFAPILIASWLDESNILLGLAIWLSFASAAFLPVMFFFVAPQILSNRRALTVWDECVRLFDGDYFAAEKTVLMLLDAPERPLVAPRQTTPIDSHETELPVVDVQDRA